LVYFFFEILPDIQRHAGGNLWDQTLNMISPRREFRQLKEALEDTDNVQNRRALADYYLRTGKHGNAIDEYRLCLQGIFQEDPDITMDLVEALRQAEKYSDALTTIESLKKKENSFDAQKKVRFQTLYAISVENVGRESEALALYTALNGRFGVGEEVRYRLARLLEKNGQKDKAMEIYQDAIKRARRFSRQYRKTQIQWIKNARAAVKRLK
jgi:hypothetical protein